jgi:tyrosyl-tRNA synthetase
MDLARGIVADFYGRAAAEEAAAEFDRVHKHRDLPSVLREVAVGFGEEGTRALSKILIDAGLATSSSDAGRKIQQGGVRLNGERVSDLHARLSPADLPLIVQAGRHAVRLVLLA